MIKFFFRGPSKTFKRPIASLNNCTTLFPVQKSLLKNTLPSIGTHTKRIEKPWNQKVLHLAHDSENAFVESIQKRRAYFEEVLLDIGFNDQQIKTIFFLMPLFSIDYRLAFRSAAFIKDAFNFSNPRDVAIWFMDKSLNFIQPKYLQFLLDENKKIVFKKASVFLERDPGDYEEAKLLGVMQDARAMIYEKIRAHCEREQELVQKLKP